jgi:hypothetical protein
MHNTHPLVGKSIILYPNDTYQKRGVVKKIDHLGYYIEIYRCDNKQEYKVGDLAFFNHAKELHFIILN